MNNFRLESSVSNTENTISSTSLNATSSMIGNDIFQLARAFLAYVDAEGATQVVYAAPQTYTY